MHWNDKDHPLDNLAISDGNYCETIYIRCLIFIQLLQIHHSDGHISGHTREEEESLYARSIGVREIRSAFCEDVRLYPTSFSSTRKGRGYWYAVQLRIERYKTSHSLATIAEDKTVNLYVFPTIDYLHNSC